MALASLRPAAYMSFLRPLALPRAATLTRFLSTSPAVQSTTEATSSTSTSSPAASSQSLEYRVSRTPSAQLPIYLLAKRGGNLKQTRVKKIEGNIAQLREDLKVALGIEEDREIQVNHLTRHIIVKGHRKPEVAKFLEEHNSPQQWSGGTVPAGSFDQVFMDFVAAHQMQMQLKHRIGDSVLSTSEKTAATATGLPTAAAAPPPHPLPLLPRARNQTKPRIPTPPDKDPHATEFVYHHMPKEDGMGCLLTDLMAPRGDENYPVTNSITNTINKTTNSRADNSIGGSSITTQQDNPLVPRPPGKDRRSISTLGSFLADKPSSEGGGRTLIYSL
ncbi:hypothetical protein V490_07513 [Pseudogymnoascus sp. VKM F-3557]|nr:hypothetical protein V490_07513 [Pseudogymnoascus sp. VKM F-3557]